MNRRAVVGLVVLGALGVVGIGAALVIGNGNGLAAPGEGANNATDAATRQRQELLQILVDLTRQQEELARQRDEYTAIAQTLTRTREEVQQATAEEHCLEEVRSRAQAVALTPTPDPHGAAQALSLAYEQCFRVLALFATDPQAGGSVLVAESALSLTESVMYALREQSLDAIRRPVATCARYGASLPDCQSAVLSAATAGTFESVKRQVLGLVSGAIADSEREAQRATVEEQRLRQLIAAVSDSAARETAPNFVIRWSLLAVVLLVGLLFMLGLYFSSDGASPERALDETVRMATVLLLVSTIVILALADQLESEAVAAMVGGIISFVLGNEWTRRRGARRDDPAPRPAGGGPAPVPPAGGSGGSPVPPDGGSDGSNVTLQPTHVSDEARGSDPNPGGSVESPTPGGRSPAESAGTPKERKDKGGEAGDPNATPSEVPSSVGATGEKQGGS